MDWIAEVDRWDKLLHSGGVTDAERTRRIEALLNAYAQAEKAMRDAAAKRCELASFVNKCRNIGTTEAARDAGITPQAARKRRARYFATGRAYPRLRDPA